MRKVLLLIRRLESARGSLPREPSTARADTALEAAAAFVQHLVEVAVDEDGGEPESLRAAIASWEQGGRDE